MMDRDEEKYQGYYLPPALGEQIKKGCCASGAHGFCEADVDVSAYGSRGA